MLDALWKTEYAKAAIPRGFPQLSLLLQDGSNQYR